MDRKKSLRQLVDLNRPPWTKIFEADGSDYPWSADDAAVRWLEERGYSVGQMQGRSPRGILKGRWSIAKWRNLRRREIAELDGTIEALGPRGTSVIVKMKVSPLANLADEEERPKNSPPQEGMRRA